MSDPNSLRLDTIMFMHRFGGITFVIHNGLITEQIQGQIEKRSEPASKQSAK